MMKFVASTVFVNEDVDMDVQLVGDMIKSEAGLAEIMKEADMTDGPIHIVDEDLSIAETVVAMLNDEYGSGEVVQPKRKLKVAFGNEVVSAEDTAEQAISNMTNQTKKNPKEEVTMTNKNNKGVTDAELLKNDAVKAFLDAQGAKMVDAKVAPVKEEKGAEEVVEEKKEVKRVTLGSRRAANQTKKEVVNNTKEEKDVKVSTKDVVKGLKGGGQAAEEKAVGGPSRRMKNEKERKADKRKEMADTSKRNMEFDEESVRGNAGKDPIDETPWYLDIKKYPAVAHIEEIVEDRKFAALGILDIRYVRPEVALGHENAKLLAVVEISFGMGNVRIRIKEDHSMLDYNHLSEAKKWEAWRLEEAADLHSTNLPYFEEFKTKELKRAYGFNRRNELKVSVKCECPGKQYPRYFNVIAGNEGACPVCGTKHKVDADVESTTTTPYIPDWTTQVLDNSSIEFNQEVFAVAMAFAQYKAGLSMYGVIEE